MLKNLWDVVTDLIEKQKMKNQSKWTKKGCQTTNFIPQITRKMKTQI